MERINKIAPLVAACGLALVAGYVPASSAAGGTKHEEFSLFELNKQEASTQFDQGDNGYSEGDYEVARSPLYHQGVLATKKNRTGTVQRVCHAIKVTEKSAITQCSATLGINGLRLSSAGIVRFGGASGSQVVHFPITGGTGKYRDASGVITVHLRKGITDFDVSIDY